MPTLHNKVCLVTGAARGIGRGIALQLGGAGATVYITGRTRSCLLTCAAEIRKRGGLAIPIVMDHNNDEDIFALFEKITYEQGGKLDVLVNNCYSGASLFDKIAGKKFWETDPIDTWDTINGVGLRNHYICTTLASRLMVDQGSGLIINISSFGGLQYLFNCAYGIGKAACDRMASDCAHELKKHNVAFVSLWPGPVRTEFVQENVMNKSAFCLSNEIPSLRSTKIFEKGESIEFSGKSILHLATDPNIMKKTGKILLNEDVAAEYGFKDIDGTIPIRTLQISEQVDLLGWTRLANCIPKCIKIPQWILHLQANKFQPPIMCFSR